MAKRPSLFTPRAPAAAETMAREAVPAVTTDADAAPMNRPPPSRAGKRVLSIYLDPLAWKQLRQLALDSDATMQALGQEAVNLLFEKHRLNRSA
jgi:hypothetical protein